MNRRLTLLFVLSLLAPAGVAIAGIYKWTDAAGVVHYSDKQPDQQAAEQVDNRYLQVPATPSVWGQQKSLLAGFRDKLLPAKPEKTNIFLITFAGDSKQDVFMRETLYIQDLFRQRYDTAGHTIALINNRETTSQYLIASRENLEAILTAYSKLMKPDDILYLYLTSHGSKQHQLVVDFEPYTDHWIDANELRALLDASGIRWRIIVVSACYSGGFIEPLKTPYSLIATAADATHTSFGCSNEREFTYYGDAVFHTLMQQGVDLLHALYKASDTVYNMEGGADSKSHSNPQFWIGDQMQPKMLDFVSRNH